MNNPNKRPALGQGLAALLGPDFSAPQSTSSTIEATQQNSQTLPINVIRSGKYQPRSYFDEGELELLAQSIRENGIIQPIVVRPVEGNTYEILAGERRWRAAERAGYTDVPVIVRENISDQKALEIALLENIQRQDLNPIEEAEGYQRLIREFGYTQEGIAQSLGKSRPHVANTLRLLNLPPRVTEALTSKKITAGHARVLLGVSATEADTMLDTILSKNLNVRQTERLARHTHLSPSAVGDHDNKVYKPEAIAELESIIEKVIQAPCAIQEKRGRILMTVSFQGFDQLDAFLNTIAK